MFVYWSRSVASEEDTVDITALLLYLKLGFKGYVVIVVAVVVAGLLSVCSASEDSIKPHGFCPKTLMSGTIYVNDVSMVNTIVNSCD